MHRMPHGRIFAFLIEGPILMHFAYHRSVLVIDEEIPILNLSRSCLDDKTYDEETYEREDKSIVRAEKVGVSYFLKVVPDRIFVDLRSGGSTKEFRLGCSLLTLDICKTILVHVGDVLALLLGGWHLE
mmetsp:Transcript_161/g.165  ORF Transcript_161/g.165 Transcript_161/m.165 type:complete len:128 (-) Transcript_161:276-659(-)